MGSFSDLSFSIIFIFFVLFHLLFCDDFFVLKVDIEQDLCFVLFKQICIGPAALKDLERAIQLALKQIIRLAGLLATRVLGIGTTTSFILAEEYLWRRLTVAFLDKEPIDVLAQKDTRRLVLSSAETPLKC